MPKSLLERFLDAADRARETGDYTEADQLGQAIARKTGTPYVTVTVCACGHPWARHHPPSSEIETGDVMWPGGCLGHPHCNCPLFEEGGSDAKNTHKQ